MATEKKSLDDIVYEKLKKAIILKKFPPSYKLVEKEIADIMKVSRTPINIAIKLLERDGLLTIIPKSSCLIKYVNNIMVETYTYDVFYKLNDPKLEKEYYTPKQHYDILDALVQKDIAKSEKAMEYHILSTETQLNLVLYDGIDNLDISLNG